MSAVIEEVVEVIKPENRKKMVKLIIDNIKKFPTKSVSEDVVTFTERVRKLVSGSSARPGPYRFSNTPQWRLPTSELSEGSKTQEVIIMAATQTGKTETLMNHQLYCVAHGIGPIAYISSDEGLALRHSETRFAPMIQAAGMQDLIQAPVKTRANKSTGDAKGLKFFKGTFIAFIGAKSESKASSTPIRILSVDEVDKFDLQLSSTKGGNPIIKLLRRTDSYGNLKKILFVSTPKRKSTSQIEPLFLQGNACYYHVECPNCHELHKIEWSNIKWDKTEDGNILLEYDNDGNLINDPVYHVCPHCSYHMHHHEKLKAMQEEGFGGKAKWVASKAPDRPGIKSFHCSGLLGFRSWLEIVLEFIEAKDDPILLEDFISDTLAETYESKIDKPDNHALMSRAEPDWVRGTIPNEVKFMALGCDVQKDRLECQITGYAPRMESWIIDYHVLSGNPNDPNDKCWNKLEEIILKEYNKMDGTPIRLQTALIDAPYENASVMAFCSRFSIYYNPNSWVGVFPTFGKQTASYIVKEHKSTISVPEILMHDQRLKGEIYGHLKKKAPITGLNVPFGYVHFPSDFESTYYEQLTNEEVVVNVDSKGIETQMILNPAGKRNEPLDCFKMCLAGLYYSYIKFFEVWNDRLKKQHKKEVQKDWTLFWHFFGGDDTGDNEE